MQQLIEAIILILIKIGKLRTVKLNLQLLDSECLRKFTFLWTQSKKKNQSENLSHSVDVTLQSIIYFGYFARLLCTLQWLQKAFLHHSTYHYTLYLIKCYIINFLSFSDTSVRSEKFDAARVKQ